MSRGIENFLVNFENFLYKCPGHNEIFKILAKNFQNIRDMSCGIENFLVNFEISYINVRGT